MSTNERAKALWLLSETVLWYTEAITAATRGDHNAAAAWHAFANRKCAELKTFLTAAPAIPVSVPPTTITTIWIGFTPPTLTYLLDRYVEFGQQFEARSKDMGRPFFTHGDLTLDLIGTGPDLALVTRLLTLREKLVELKLGKFFVEALEVGVKFANAMARLGIPYIGQHVSEEYVGWEMFVIQTPNTLRTYDALVTHSP